MFFNGRKIFLLLPLLFSLQVFADGVPPYNRGQWKHWIDEDRDCQDTRQEVLIAASEIQVTFKTDRRCKVASGQWPGPYIGRELNLPEIQVDHLVPLKHAHDTGGYRWSAYEKQVFANDVENLIPVYGRENMRKGSRGPDEYRPPNRQFWCAYARRWRYIKAKYRLDVSESERQAVDEMIQEGCDGRRND